MPTLSTSNTAPAYEATTNPTFVAPTKKEKKEILLPSNTRYVRTANGSINFLVELKPGLFPFKFHVYDLRNYSRPDLKNQPKTMPWQYFWLWFREPTDNIYGIQASFNGMHLFWAQERITDLDSLVYPARLPNTTINASDYYSRYGLGTCCLGGHYRPKTGVGITEAAEEAVRLFYESRFNSAMNNAWPIPFASTTKWARESKKNPYGWMEWKELVNAKKYPLNDLLKNCTPKGA
jgi:hypothetical protein